MRRDFALTEAHRLGSWAATAVMVTTTAWFILFLAQVALLPQGWHGIEEYARRFTSMELANLWPAILLAWSYLLLVVALHATVEEEKRVWTLAGLAFGIVYATMATINYTVQIAVVAPNLRAGRLDGLHIWVGANFDSVFWALALGYAVMALSMLALWRAFPEKGWGPGRFFLIGGISAPLQLGFGLLDWPAWVGAPGTLFWLIGILGAGTALRTWFVAPAPLAK